MNKILSRLSIILSIVGLAITLFFCPYLKKEKKYDNTIIKEIQK